MKEITTIKINFKGGIIPADDLYNILIAASKAGILYIRFGLRQQLYIDVEDEKLSVLKEELNGLDINYEAENEKYPNIISSYPAEEVFTVQSWLTEEKYKYILNSFGYNPLLKINISDCNQSFTPLLTGNINWVASADEKDYWHLFIRFPKTNTIYEWDELVNSNSIAYLSAEIEKVILREKSKFYDNNDADGNELNRLVNRGESECKKISSRLVFPVFKLPYYEGMNRHRNKYWLGIYRRDELFSIRFLKEACLLCLDSGIAELCSTTWKSIIIKNITEERKNDWYVLLDKYQVNVRHAQNELNFQVDDNSMQALKLKMHLVKYLNDDDTRTFGVCVGIKTRKKSEVFSSILVRRKPLIRIGKFEAFFLYDILCAQDFNPNERTAFAFSKDNPRFLLAEQLRRAILSFYHFHGKSEEVAASIIADNVVTESEL